MCMCSMASLVVSAVTALMVADRGCHVIGGQGSDLRGVGFYVIQSGNYYIPSGGHVITMNQVVTNEGNGWDSANNKFVAPIKGVYVFSAGATPVSGGMLYSYIDAGSHRIEMRSHTNHHLVSSTLPVMLEKGEEATFRGAEGVTLQGCGVTKPCIMFSGFLLYPME